MAYHGKELENTYLHLTVYLHNKDFAQSPRHRRSSTLFVRLGIMSPAYSNSDHRYNIGAVVKLASESVFWTVMEDNTPLLQRYP